MCIVLLFIFASLLVPIITLALVCLDRFHPEKKSPILALHSIIYTCYGPLLTRTMQICMEYTCYGPLLANLYGIYLLWSTACKFAWYIHVLVMVHCLQICKAVKDIPLDMQNDFVNINECCAPAYFEQMSAYL